MKNILKFLENRIPEELMDAYRDWLKDPIEDLEQAWGDHKLSKDEIDLAWALEEAHEADYLLDEYSELKTAKVHLRSFLSTMGVSLENNL